MGRSMVVVQFHARGPNKKKSATMPPSVHVRRAGNGSLPLALKLFENMVNAEVQHDVISYSAAISVCAKGGQT